VSWWWYVEGDSASDYTASSERNVTYNVGRMLERALHGLAVREWSGMTLLELGQRAAEGLVRIATQREEFDAMAPANGWGSTRSVIDDLLWLVGWMAHAPYATLRVS
jgi:hypothetical protein